MELTMVLPFALAVIVGGLLMFGFDRLASFVGCAACVFAVGYRLFQGDVIDNIVVDFLLGGAFVVLVAYGLIRLHALVNKRKIEN